MPGSALVNREFPPLDWIFTILGASWTMLVQAAPYILFGLAVAGLMHVLLPESLVLRWMGAPGLWGVVRAALIGVPLPVCSCGVVPITVELRRKGASRPASQSFLITTPESSIDSIFLTWGMMGPVMAIARPIAAFFTAVLGGILSIASARTVDELSSDRQRLATDETGDDPAAPETHGHGHGHDHSHDHDHSHGHAVAFAGSARARLALRRALGLRESPPLIPPRGHKGSEKEEEDGEGTQASEQEDDETSLWRDLLKPSLRYGFGELLDDLAFWLVVGIGLAGVLAALLPDNLDELGLGTGLLPMIALLVVGIPLYMCASASTPIAAALMLKGISPGAALVFLLAGPATNAATVLQLAATFGRRFVGIYVISVAAGALAAGLLLDALLGDADVTESLRLSGETAPGPFMVFMALLLAGLLGRSLVRGAWAQGVDELRRADRRMRAHLPVFGRLHRRHLLVALLLLFVTAYAASGFQVVPAGGRGYGFLFGALARSDLEPGLHYLPPAPFGRWEVRYIDYPRKSDVGFRTDLDLIANRRERVRRMSRDEWHSPVAAMGSDPAQASYLTGDGNLVEVSFSIHYMLKEATTFFYGIDHRRDFVNLYAESAARELIAGLLLDELLTERRAEVEGRILETLQKDLDEQRLGIDVFAVRIIDLHPPGAAVPAFRDVSSAKEDRETKIHKARGDLAQALPRARGKAAQHVAKAEAQALRRRQEAQGESRAFAARAEPFGDHRALLGHLLWIETVERALAGREKLILPPGSTPSASRDITLWHNAKPPMPTFPESDR